MARKRPWSFCKTCRLQVTSKHAYTLDPSKSEWTDYAAVQALRGNLTGNELTRKLSRNIRPLLSQLPESLWTDPGIKSGISVRELISTSKTKNRKRRMNGRTFFSKILASEEKAAANYRSHQFMQLMSLPAYGMAVAFC